MVWESAGDGEFTIGAETRESRGTEITLHFKDDAKEFLDDWRLKSIIRKYSDHIQMPIVMKKSEWDDAEIPKPGSIKMAEWKSNKQNAEEKSSAPEQQAKFTV